MELSDLLHGLGRAPWSGAARHILMRANYELRHGYPNTVRAILAEPDDPAKKAALADGLIEHDVAGEKLVQLVRLSPAEKRRVDTWIRSKRMFTNDLTDAFPGSAPQSLLPPHYTSAPTAAGYADLADGIAAIYTAARSYVKSEPIPTDSLRPTAAAGFERIIGYKRKFVQTYDAIWLPSNGDFAVFAIDLPTDVPKSDFARAGAAFLNAQLRRELGRSLNFANFWHPIDGLYRSTSGKMVDYGFSAGGQSVNNHRARRKGAVCLRSAVYDAAGAQAIRNAGSSLELFKIAIEWSFRHHDAVTTQPEILIPGKAQDLNKAMPIVSHCIVRDCLGSPDLNFVISKVAPLVTNWV